MTLTSPPPCANSVMSAAADGPTNEKVVLLDAGNYPSFSSFVNETWVFNGSTLNWVNTGTTLVDPNGPLPGRINATMSYDGYSVMLFGGQGASSTTGVLDDTWLWNGASWTRVAPTNQPFGRYKSAATFLSGTGVVMFGGENLLSKLNETWVWQGNPLDGYFWTNVSPANGTGPAARTDHMMASSSSLVVLFGGEGNNSQFNDTWTFNGTTWTKLNPATSPSVRSDACFSYDSTNNIWVMFGGHNAYNYLNETWTFNGTTWSQVAVANGTGPSGNIGAQMCFDTVSAKTIMFGGVTATSTNASAQTWSFNGSTLVWTQL